MGLLLVLAIFTSTDGMDNCVFSQCQPILGLASVLVSVDCVRSIIEEPLWPVLVLSVQTHYPADTDMT